MKHPFLLRSIPIIILMLITASPFSCKKDNPVAPPKVDDDEEYTILLEVYRTGADLLAVDEYKSDGFDGQISGC